MEDLFEIIVVGGGHAGCEAAVAGAKMGSKVLLITTDLNRMAQMSCNPSIGGIGKGQIVREIDALGGLTARITDLSTIHFRLLNRSKGPAMWSPRAQCDKNLFSYYWRCELEKIPNLFLFQDTVIDLLFSSDDSTIEGVVTKNGFRFNSRAVILTNGTFLNGLIHIGETNFAGGRIGEDSVTGVTEALHRVGFSFGRMKTGTPVRVDSRTIDFSKLVEQPTEPSGRFSFDYSIKSTLEHRSCFIAHTSAHVHDILRHGFNSSPLFTGRIQGIGPRYCPSIETKIDTFSDKESHQLFLEPEGVATNEMYLNGFSSSLPWRVQFEALRSVVGFENAIILRPGYAIEYDYFPPTQLHRTLETKLVRNLYFAGQINGTTGYEEAAGQGLVAGINAHLSINGGQPFVLRRDEAYIGVMIDDLTTKGVDEPYRVFTSRAEFRILIRHDNADERLTPKAYRLGLIDESRFRNFERKYSAINSAIHTIKTSSVEPASINSFLSQCGSAPLTQRRRWSEIIVRPEISLSILNRQFKLFRYRSTRFYTPDDILQAADTRIKYQGYLDKEQILAEKMLRLEYVLIPENFNFNKLESLSTEARQKLSFHNPKSIGEAKKIPGISPSDINVLLVFFGR